MHLKCTVACVKRWSPDHREGGVDMLTQHWVEDTQGIHAEWLEDPEAIDLSDVTDADVEVAD